ncbi:MAG TPA: hypothetical protein VFH61_17040 [Thermoleophilia bacterium]|nr:hypothetical protein [Thermoleophilia bacterium]
MDSSIQWSSDLFSNTGNAAGTHREDDDRLQLYPDELEYIRLVIEGELEEANLAGSGATHVSIFADRDFDGCPTGQRHRMFLRRGRRAS